MNKNEFFDLIGDEFSNEFKERLWSEYAHRPMKVTVYGHKPVKMTVISFLDKKSQIAEFKQYLKNRFYFRGFSWLGILNTVLAVLFNRVLVRYAVQPSNETIKWALEKGTDHPQEK